MTGDVVPMTPADGLTSPVIGSTSSAFGTTSPAKIIKNFCGGIIDGGIMGPRYNGCTLLIYSGFLGAKL